MVDGGQPVYPLARPEIDHDTFARAIFRLVEKRVEDHDDSDPGLPGRKAALLQRPLQRREWHDRGHRQGWLTEHLIRADVHAARLERVLDAVQPQRVWHGHLHQRTNVAIDDAPWGSYRIQGLAHDERPAANAVVVTLDGREASR